MLIILIVRKFLAFFLAVPDFLLTFATVIQDDSNLSGRATVSPMAPQPQAFFMPRKIFFFLTGKIIFPNWENRYVQYMAAA